MKKYTDILAYTALYSLVAKSLDIPPVCPTAPLNPLKISWVYNTTNFHSAFSEKTFLKVYTQNMSAPQVVDRINKYIQTSTIETKILWSLVGIIVICLICGGPILICYICPALCTCLKIFKLCGIQCCSNKIEARILKIQGRKNLQAMYTSRAGRSSSTFNVKAPAASAPPSFHPSPRSF